MIVDRLWDNLNAILTFFSGLAVVFFGTRYTVKRQQTGKLNEVKMEGDVKTEELFVSNMGVILSEYKEQVSAYKEQVSAYKELLEANNEQITVLQGEFNEFKEQHQKEVTVYKEKIVFLEKKVEDLEDENESLKEVIEKGEINNVK